MNIKIYMEGDMKDDERKDYLDRWGSSCHVCGVTVEREDMKLMKSIVELTVCPEHADPFLSTYYMICPACAKDKLCV